MPASQRSLAITDAYRNRLLATVQRVERQTRARWPGIEDFDSGSQAWLSATVATVTGAQREAVRATSGYLAAFLTSELGRRSQSPPLDSRKYAGIARDGRPLTESLRSPIIGTLAALKEGREPPDALQIGLDRALRAVELDVMQNARQALRDGMEADERIEGWQRGVRGTCGACAGDIAVEVSVQLPSVPLRIHPNCMCVTVPVVTGVRNRFPLLTGQQIFERKSKAEQDEALGAEAAERVRSGDVSLADLVATSPLATEPDFISQAPVGAQ